MKPKIVHKNEQLSPKSNQREREKPKAVQRKPPPTRNPDGWYH